MSQVINVSSKSSTKTLADIISQHLKEDEDVILKAIGAGAVNQAVKALAICGINNENNFYTKFSFFNVIINGEEKSGIIFEVKKEEKNGQV